jgi:hypothetical protein
LVRYGAAFYAKPSADTIVQPRDATYDSYELFRFVSDHGDFLPKSRAWATQHCNYAVSLGGLRALLVARKDVSPVISRAVTVSWPNGTSISGFRRLCARCTRCEQ